MQTDLPCAPADPKTATPGFLWRLYSNPLQALTGLAREHGDMAHLKLRRRDVYLLNHPDFIEEVLVNQQRKFVKGPSLRRARIVLGDGLLTSEGEEHLAQRRTLQPAFHRKRMEEYLPLMVSRAQAHIERWHDGGRVDMADEMMRLTLDIALWAFFGSSPEDAAERVGESMQTLMRLFPLTQLPVPDWTRSLFPRFRRASSSLRRVTDALLAEPRSEPAQRALVHILKQNNGGQFTDEQVHAHALTFLLAGHETTALVLGWAWDMLAHHPHVQEKLQAEVDRALGDRPPLGDDLGNLNYTRMVVKETLRLRPPAWVMGRQAAEDCAIGGQRIAAGSVALVSQWVMHQDPRYYADPQTFQPERWVEIERMDFPRYAFFPFGGGARVCIGEHFAMTEAVAVLALLARRWNVIPADPAPAGLNPSVTLRPRGGISLILERREHN